MASLRDIKRRIKSVKNTQQITKAMKMVSAAKLRRAEEEIKSARPYAIRLSELIGRLASRAGEDAHPLLKAKEEVSKRELIVFTSDRGLCGAYNSGILKTCEGFIKNTLDEDIEISLTLIGRKAQTYFKRRGYNIRREVVHPGRSDYDWASSLSTDLTDSYLNDTFDEVFVAYGEFKSVMVQKPTIKRILPVEIEEKEGVEGLVLDYIYEPSIKAILNQILPQYVHVLIFRALLESLASEHGARMTAMDSATKNATEMIARLTLYYNRARQAAITTELMDIVNGVEAMKK